MSRYLLLIQLLLLWSCGKTPETIAVSWEELSVPSFANINDLDFVSPQEGYLAGGEQFQYGLVLSTQDGGETWQIDSLDAQEMQAIQVEEDQILTAGDGGQLFVRPVSGNLGWRRINLPTFEPFTAMDVHQDQIWLCSGVAFQNGNIFQIDTNQELRTQSSYEQELSAITYLANDLLFAVGYGLLLESEDNGQTWTQIPIWGDFFRDIHFPSLETGYVVGQTGHILKTRDRGQQWQRIRDPGKARTARAPLRAVDFIDETRGCIVGENGLVWLTVNGGESWNQIADFPSTDLKAVQILENQTYLAGEHGRLFRLNWP